MGELINAIGPAATVFVFFMTIFIVVFVGMALTGGISGRGDQ